MVPIMLALQGADEVRVRDSLHALYKLGVILLSMCKRIEGLSGKNSWENPLPCPRPVCPILI